MALPDVPAPRETQQSTVPELQVVAAADDKSAAAESPPDSPPRASASSTCLISIGFNYNILGIALDEHNIVNINQLL